MEDNQEIVEQPQSTEQEENIAQKQDQTAIMLKTVMQEYVPNPKDNPKAKMRMEKIGGTVNGVFAREPISTGELIATFEGPVLTADKISELPSRYLQDHVIQVGETKYLMNREGIAHYLNHSCDPNCGIVDGVKNFENLTADKITPQHIQELTDLIRYVFSNDWAEYAYCPKCDPKTPHGKKLSVRDIFDVDDDTYVPLEELNDTSRIPTCDNCGTQMQLFMDPETSYKTLEGKLEKNAWLSLMRNVQGDVVGANYAYVRSLKEVFEKEWKKYYSYADPATSPDKTRDWKNFYKRMSAAMKEKQESRQSSPVQEISEDMEVVCSNLIVIAPEYRNKGHFFNLSTQTFMIDGAMDHIHKFGLCESVRNTKAHKLFMRGGSTEVPGILQDASIELKEDDYVMLLFKISEFFESFFRG